jgi:hypothetical protein
MPKELKLILIAAAVVLVVLYAYDVAVIAYADSDQLS